jgi:uncharacterized membrane-anchored protein YitT (DUF2179 family)
MMVNQIKKSLNQRRLLIRDYIAITAGAFIMASGIAVFLVDAKVVPGGVSGLSMAIYYFTNGRVPIGMMIWVLNIPLYIWGVRELGKQFGARTFVGFTLNSFFIDLLRGQVPGLTFIRLNEHPAIINLQKNDFLFLILIGAVLLGIGLGIIFKFRGSTAGSDVIAAVAQKRWGIKPGTVFMMVDSIVILLAGFIIHLKGLDIERHAITLTLYAFFLLFVSSHLVDVIIDGFDYAHSAIIISDQAEEIGRRIIAELDRTATLVDATGVYTQQKRKALYAVVTRKQVGDMVAIIKETDPQAFVILNNVHEVLGEGFRGRI